MNLKTECYNDILNFIDKSDKIIRKRKYSNKQLP